MLREPDPKRPASFTHVGHVTSYINPHMLFLRVLSLEFTTVDCMASEKSPLSVLGRWWSVFLMRGVSLIMLNVNSACFVIDIDH